jgi:hypothetical protein
MFFAQTRLAEVGGWRMGENRICGSFIFEQKQQTESILKLF